MNLAMPEGWGDDSMGWGGSLVSGGGGGGGGPGPVVTNFDPPKDTPIFPSQALSFDVLFDNPVVAIVISVDYGDTGAKEVAYDMNGFSVNYQPNGSFPGSERQPITGGWHFILRRRGGWFASPTVRVQGADDQGGAITETP